MRADTDPRPSSRAQPSPVLYLVATPIGNLEDITFRALRALKEVSLIAAEDTRRTRQLLHHFDISTRTTSYHEHSPPSRLQELVAHLRSGESLALVTDAGTPGISDPGYELVCAAIENGITVTPIPGPCAVLAALVASGLPTSRFVFEGFLPRQRSARAAILERLRTEPRTTVLFEAPHRLLKTLQEMESALGPRPLVVARELTKLHEEFWRGDLQTALQRWAGEVRGELVLVLGGAADTPPGAAAVDAAAADLEATLAEFIAGGMSRRDAARAASEQCRVPYREAYRLATRITG